LRASKPLRSESNPQQLNRQTDMRDFMHLDKQRCSAKVLRAVTVNKSGQSKQMWCHAHTDHGPEAREKGTRRLHMGFDGPVLGNAVCLESKTREMAARKQKKRKLFILTAATC